MSVNADDFFKSKNEWSEIKDGLLASYLHPYAMKILATRRPLVYVDFFAGKGRFDDGNLGSPLIALGVLSRVLGISKASNPRISAQFYDIRFADDLRLNLQAAFRSNSRLRYTVEASRYEDAVCQWLTPRHENAFMYIDPFGIKSLNMRRLFELNSVFDSVEVLLNLNTFGFIREACRYYKVDVSQVAGLEDVDDFEVPDDVNADSRSTWLSDVAGGDYWKEIVKALVSKEIDGFEAEKRFAFEFCKKLSGGFKYVLNFPLRTKSVNRPKYRMIHACNHVDGCMLMYETMSKQKAIWYCRRAKGQLSMFEESAEEELVDLSVIEQELCDKVNSYSAYAPRREILADFLVEKGIICSEPDINKALSNLERNGRISVLREPAETKNGKGTTFWTETASRRVFLKGSQSDEMRGNN